MLSLVPKKKLKLVIGLWGKQLEIWVVLTTLYDYSFLILRSSTGSSICSKRERKEKAHNSSIIHSRIYKRVTTERNGPLIYLFLWTTLPITRGLPHKHTHQLHSRFSLNTITIQILLFYSISRNNIKKYWD